MSRLPRAIPAYYIRIDTYWQHSPDTFVGPFASREAAQAAIDAIRTEDNVWLSTSTCGGDIRSAVRVYPAILTASEAKRMGMRNDYGARHNVVPRMPVDGYDLFDLLEGAYGPY